MRSHSSHSDRPAVNRQNAAHSTGPKTPAGKQRSSQNSLKHGLYSKALILPFEDPAEFDELRTALVAEHQPATATEILLVDEIAQSAWRMRRFRLCEQSVLDADDLDLILLTLFQRALASAERAFHRALTALAKLRKDFGFVPVNRESRFEAKCPQQNRVRQQAATPSGFVPEKPCGTGLQAGASHGFVPQNCPNDQSPMHFDSQTTPYNSEE